MAKGKGDAAKPSEAAVAAGRPFGEVLADLVAEIRHAGALSRQDAVSELDVERLKFCIAASRDRLVAAGDELLSALKVGVHRRPGAAAVKPGRSSPWWTTATPPAPSFGRSSASYAWEAPHTNRKARIRYLRQRCREVLEPRDGDGKAALAAAIALADEFDDPETALLLLGSRALDIREATGVPWQSALDYVVQKERADRLARAAEERAAEEPTRSIITADPPPAERETPP